MERSEKALVPEWLKVANGGTSGGGGSTSHLSASSSKSDRTSSSYFRRSSSSNDATMHEKDISVNSRPYSSFGRTYRERDREKDLAFWTGDYDTSDSTLTSRINKDALRRSQSMISGKRGDVCPRRLGNDMSNGLPVGGSIRGNINKAAFEKDFPSLGAEERQGVPDISRVPSPGLSSTSQSLPIGASSVIGGECWTSALAQLPVTVGSNGNLSSAQQAASTSSACVALSTTMGLNMAETLAQAPARTRTTPQLSVETQRLEELAFKQSRQLIPMTPSMPKTSVLADKLKSKSVRSSDLSTVTKVGQQPSSSQLVNHAVRGNTRSDVSKPSHAGKLTVLKPAREKNDASPAKDGPSPTNTSRVLPGAVQSTAFAPLRSPINPKLATDSGATAFSVTKNAMDRKPLSQSRDRIDFFNSIRKKTSANHSAAIPDSRPIEPSSFMSEKSDDQTTAFAAAGNKDAPASGPELEWSPGNGTDMAGNGVTSEESKIDLSSDVPDEEEAAFLRSMGWEENAEAAAPITEEEINAFYEELKLWPSSKLSRKQQSKVVPVESHVGSMDSASSILSSSDSEAEA